MEIQDKHLFYLLFFKCHLKEKKYVNLLNCKRLYFFVYNFMHDKNNDLCNDFGF